MLHGSLPFFLQLMTCCGISMYSGVGLHGVSGRDPWDVTLETVLGEQTLSQLLYRNFCCLLCRQCDPEDQRR